MSDPNHHRPSPRQQLHDNEVKLLIQTITDQAAELIVQKEALKSAHLTIRELEARGKTDEELHGVKAPDKEPTTIVRSEFYQR